MNVSEWKWFGYPGHLIVSGRCQFHLCTQVGDYLISTVGDFRPDREDGKRKTIGAGKDSFFETFVFKAGEPCSAPECGCGVPELDGGCGIDGECTATPGEATAAHMRYCAKYADVQNRRRNEP